MNKNDFYELRKQIILNSLFLKDYRNNLCVSPKTAYSFFDSAIEYINDDYKEKTGRDIDIENITTSMLYDYYKYLEYDALVYDDYIASLSFMYGCGLLFYLYDASGYYALISYYYEDDMTGLHTSKPRWHKIYYSIKNGDYIIFNKRRYYLNNFYRRAGL